MPTSRISPQEALIYSMVTVSAADRAITTDEISRIGSIVRELPPFLDYTDDWLADAAQDCGKILRRPDGIADVLALIKSSLEPAPLRDGLRPQRRSRGIRSCAP